MKWLNDNVKAILAIVAIIWVVWTVWNGIVDNRRANRGRAMSIPLPPRPPQMPRMPQWGD